RRINLRVIASTQDIGVLNINLYSAFDALPVKVTMVNHHLSPDVSVTIFKFIHVQQVRANG
ncbi:class I adenylate cyclase, partial [Salmonella enterica]|uniref:class I adenylate cyclase n=1 Tax=Salmonella enterica TaxID=28901 RepID=UPI0020C24A1F